MWATILKAPLALNTPIEEDVDVCLVEGLRDCLEHSALIKTQILPVVPPIVGEHLDPLVVSEMFSQKLTN